PSLPARGNCGRPAVLAGARFVVLVVALTAATLGIACRSALGLSVVAMVFLVLGDQERFQAWVYQFLMIAMFLAAVPGPTALLLARWWYIATYVYSGLSKLDVTFCHELGRLFLETACRPWGVDPATWPGLVRNGAILAMPVGEIAVALALCHPATRRSGRFVAVLLHVILILLLGPWGLGHSAIV